MRHGKPAPQPATWISGRQLGQWIRAFNQTGLDESSVVPAAVRDLVPTIGIVVASDLPRSKQSAARLMAHAGVRVESDLREAGLPHSLKFAVRAPASVWLVIARLAWWLNVVPADETIAAARLRAQRVTKILKTLAREYGSILVVGHGIFNSFIAKELRMSGWEGSTLRSSRFWSTATYTSEDR